MFEKKLTRHVLTYHQYTFAKNRGSRKPKRVGKTSTLIIWDFIKSQQKDQDPGEELDWKKV